MPESEVVQDDDTASVAVDRLIEQAVEKINQGSITYEDLLDLVTQPPADVVIPQPSVPATIKKSEREALERLADVFGVVAPIEVRALEGKEIDLLLDERATLKTIEGMVKSRMSDGIRQIVLNHNDEVFAEGKPEDEIKEAERTPDGHHVVAQKHPGEGERDKQFSVEVRKGKAQIDPRVLEALGDSEEVDWMDHADYLAMTTQVRVFDEAKVMLLLKKKPHLVRAIREATTRGHSTVSVYERKA